MNPHRIVPVSQGLQFQEEPDSWALTSRLLSVPLAGPSEAYIVKLQQQERNVCPDVPPRPSKPRVSVSASSSALAAHFHLEL